MFKTKKITKGLFCCVGSFCGQSAVPCDKHTKSRPFLQRFLSLAGVLVLILSFISFDVFAESVNGNEFISMDDYAKYSFPENDPDSVYVDYYFPTEWNVTWVHGENWVPFYGSYKGSSITAPLSLGDKFCLRMRPLGGNMQNGEQAGDRITGGHFMDLSVFPVDSWFQPSFTVRIKTGSVDLSAMTGNIYLYFVDADGVIVKKISYYNPPSVSVDGDYTVYSYARTFKLSELNLPVNAVGLIPLYTLKNVECTAEEITVSYNPLWVGYNLSALQYEVQTNQKLQNTMNSVQSALAEQGEKIDNLPVEIGDQMQNVMDSEKEQSKDEGNKFVDQILDKLPDPSQGILDALGDLTSAINYTGTDATLQIPAIVLPGIGGLFPETEIWGGTEFSFSEYVEMLPSGLLTLVKSLFTIAIVLFCVYELKGIISYCLTLREKDGG